MGNKPTVSAERVVRAIALHPEPIVAPRDLNEELGLTPDGARERMKSLVEEGYLRQKKPGSSAIVFWLSDEGRDLLARLDD